MLHCHFDHNRDNECLTVIRQPVGTPVTVKLGSKMHGIFFWPHWELQPPNLSIML